MIELAAALGDPAVLAGSLATRAADRVDLGRLDAARADLDRAEQLARQHQLPQNLLIIGWCRATLLQMEGDFAGAEAAIAELEALQATLAMAGEGIGLCQLAVLRLHAGPAARARAGARGRGAVLPAVPRAARPGPRRGRAGRTTPGSLIGPWADQPTPPRDYLWTTSRRRAGPAVVGAWATRWRSPSCAARSTPYADRFAGTLPVAFLGSDHQVLGELAVGGGRPSPRLASTC